MVVETLECDLTYWTSEVVGRSVIDGPESGVQPVGKIGSVA